MTPEGVEIPRSLVDMEMQEKIRTMPKEFQPRLPSGPDPKWRYMWRIGQRPSNTNFQVPHFSSSKECLTINYSSTYDLFQELNSEPVVPEGFPEWKETMNSWGFKMISAVEVAFPNSCDFSPCFNESISSLFPLP